MKKPKLIFLDEKDRPVFPNILSFNEWILDNNHILSIENVNKLRESYDDYIESFDEIGENFNNYINIYSSVDAFGEGYNWCDANLDELLVLGKCNKLVSNKIDDISYLIAGKKNGVIHRLYMAHLNNGKLKE